MLEAGKWGAAMPPTSKSIHLSILSSSQSNTHKLTQILLNVSMRQEADLQSKQ